MVKGGGREEVPVCCYDGIAFDVDPFGLGFLADAGTGGFVFLFLEWTRHVLEGFGRCDNWKYGEGDRFGNSENRIEMDESRHKVGGNNSAASGSGTWPANALFTKLLNTAKFKNHFTVTTL